MMLQAVWGILNMLFLLAGTYTLVKKLNGDSGRTLSLLISFVLLLSVIGYLYYFMLVLRQPFMVLQVFITLVNIAHFYYGRTAIAACFSLKNYRFFNNGLLPPLILVFILTICFAFGAGKYGSWDAWAMWNTHAKFLYYPQYWTDLFSSKLSYSALDYPLMLPGLVAYFWHALGSMSPLVPMFLGYPVFIAVPLLVYYALRRDGYMLSAFIALGIFAIDANFRLIALSQCADTLLSLLILLVFVQSNNLKEKPGGQVYLLGYICGSCSWVKNEGMLFCLVFTLFFIVANYKHRALAGRYLVGLAIPLLVYITFKAHYAPANDLISGENKQLTSLSSVLTDPGRYMLIIKYFVSTVFTNYPYALMLILALLIHHSKAFLTGPFALIGAMLVAYFAIYLISPHELNWHLYTSLYRVYQQVYPALIYLLLLSFGNISNRPTTLKVSSN